MPIRSVGEYLMALNTLRQEPSKARLDLSGAFLYFENLGTSSRSVIGQSGPKRAEPGAAGGGSKAALVESPGSE